MGAATITKKAGKTFEKLPPMAQTGIVLGALFLGYKLYKSISQSILDQKTKNAGDKVDSKDPNTAYSAILAQRAFAAFFPSGNTWLPDGTNESELYKIAGELYVRKIPFATFTSVYQKLYNRVFVNDLNEELNSNELTTFYDFLKGVRLNGIGSITNLLQ